MGGMANGALVVAMFHFLGFGGTGCRETTANQYVEVRNGAYYLSGVKVSLASVVHAFRNGASRELILQDSPLFVLFPTLQSRSGFGTN